ncbi:hypothetical protein mRhiFer1_008567 [Rhinolophus ferrumequinum]|uniref:Uncharacterized protein n=1 Tax=Rhinolophus ferrumequinum TaxID=59479 RepID=A0A7J7UJQ9_RHIFE|nr:hypothetical protein mRhiFer1_008567 [Rhinolophus ferrumequinum]
MLMSLNMTGKAFSIRQQLLLQPKASSFPPFLLQVVSLSRQAVKAGGQVRKQSPKRPSYLLKAIQPERALTKEIKSLMSLPLPDNGLLACPEHIIGAWAGLGGPDCNLGPRYGAGGLGNALKPFVNEHPLKH